MKRAFMIHRWSGGPTDDWRPWLKSELEKRGYEVFVPDMPDTDIPVIQKWVDHISKIVGTPDKDTYFIGHSIGCQAVLRYLETVHTPVGGALFVAGWFNLENLEDDEMRAVAKPWIETPLNIEKIRAVLPKSILVISDNDPYGAFKENTERFAEIMTHASVLPGAGHITQKIEPALLEQFLNLVQ